MFCSKCGNEIEDGEKFCSKCGAKINTYNIQKCNEKQKVINNKKWLKILIIGTVIMVIGLLGLAEWITVINRPKPNTNTHIETEEEKQERIKRQEENNKIENAIKQFGELVRETNQGSVKYSNYSKYGTNSKGEIIYKVKYSTSTSSNKYSRIFYYQLVSLNSTNTEVIKSGKLYKFNEDTIDGKTTSSGDTYSMEYEYEQIWGN